MSWNPVVASRANSLNSNSQGRPSVKYLTCYFWGTNGYCHKTERDCLYAHKYTGQLADPPIQVRPGLPAVAGKNAQSTYPVYRAWNSGSEVSREEDGFVGAYSTGERVSDTQEEVQKMIDDVLTERHMKTYDQNQRTTTMEQVIYDQQTSLDNANQESSEIAKDLVGHCSRILHLAREMTEEHLHVPSDIIRLVHEIDGLNRTVDKVENLTDKLTRAKRNAGEQLHEAGLGKLTVSNDAMKE